MRSSAWFSFPRTVRLVCVSLLFGASLATVAQSTTKPVSTANSLQPLVERARGGQCVEEPAIMRRNHMDLLRHQRGDVLRSGVRSGKYSLKECVACHASQTTGSVAAAPSDFCQSCHDYAGVKTDCFECHANKPMGKP